MSARILPLSRLAGACEDQLAIVRREWPGGIPLTKATARRVAKLNLDADWAAEHLLWGEAQDEYWRARGKADAEYERVKSKAWAEYQRVMLKALTEFRGKMALTLRDALLQETRS